jgi:HD-like signal output (HDOD) protein
MKRRVLFVDDDPNVLEALKRMLFGMRHQWEMAFVTGAEMALHRMARAPFDVVVSDMRMPGIDGAQLLYQIRDRYPQVARIMLSGHSDRETILQLVGPTHQYLAKPCPPEVLKAAVTRALALRELTANAALRDVVTHITALPSLPAVYTEIVKAIENDACSVNEIGRIIEKDIGMMAKIMQLVNSAFFGLPRAFSSPAEAVSYLGLDTIRSLVLSTGVFSQFSEIVIPGFSLRQLWDHSMSVGLFAKHITIEETKDKKLADFAFLAGLFHDIGKLVLASQLPHRYGEILAEAKKEGLPDWQVEEKRLGATHAALGAYLLGLWGMNDMVVEAVAFHHIPNASVAENRFNPVAAVHAADAVAFSVVVAYSDHFDHHAGLAQNVAVQPGLDCEYLDRLKLGHRADAWKELCCEVVAGKRSMTHG